MNDKLPTYAKQPITIRPQIPEVVVLIDEYKAAEISAALEAAKAITRVGPDNFDEANRATKAIAGLASGLEKSRKEIKAPFLAAGRAIDDAAREHAETLEAAKRRLADLVGAHLEEEERKRREEARRQREALEAAARQAAEAERLAREEEARRQREIDAAKRREEEAARKAAAEVDATKRAELEAQARIEAAAAAELESQAREEQDAMDDLLEEVAVVELPEVRERKSPPSPSATWRRLSSSTWRRYRRRSTGSRSSNSRWPTRRNSYPRASTSPDSGW